MTAKEKGDFVHRIKELIKEGNARRVIVKNKEGDIIAQFPLTAGVAGAVLAPVLTALSAIVALITHCSIGVERK